MENSLKIKLILLGDHGVGKTSLINQYVNGKFQKKPTDFPEPLSKGINVKGKHVILQIHDTCGRELQERGLEATFFSDAKACMFVYDVKNYKSMENLENWHNEFSTKVVPNPSKLEGFPFIVLGNKADQNDGKELNPDKAIKWCQNKAIRHFFTSAKDNKHVVDAFEALAELAVKYEPMPSSTVKRPLKPDNPTIGIHPPLKHEPIKTPLPDINNPPKSGYTNHPTPKKDKDSGCCTIL